MAKYLYVVGGQQKGRIQEEWKQYQKGVILKIDLETREIKPCLNYQSPPEVTPDSDSSILFKAGTLIDNQLYVCTQTEVLIYSVPDFNLLHYVSLPLFNDVHHVCPAKDGSLLVVNTGLDMVLNVDLSGKILGVWNVLQKNPWERFSKSVDYRKVLTTKPHQSHPNYVFQVGDDVWATRCLQKDAICLTNPSKRIEIGERLIHDGIVVGNSIYFTRVDGTVFIADIKNQKIKAQYDLKSFSLTPKSIGWCRGILVLNDHTIIVGFSRLRPTQYVDEKGKQVRKGEYGAMPTRLACYDLKNKKMLWQLPLESHGLNSIFSIHLHEENE
ncbi:hypothetical protein PU629_12495 [Pullulanibacillus sp. KACC 23026]|uniref:hypothetical protein n=1 Tax=Pullulanibacillus sp. KACC 23026 TaxID=3028315 RepID=UPI0023B0ABFD|nr:hypothetical protein [Pullulanibacillus sp. KACC 23026]WEG10996.1 hypothetical protein PU629_12495 [Pullulanibacillus sp. KACC 23026]